MVYIFHLIGINLTGLKIYLDSHVHNTLVLSYDRITGAEHAFVTEISPIKAQHSS